MGKLLSSGIAPLVFISDCKVLSINNFNTDLSYVNKTLCQLMSSYLFFDTTKKSSPFFVSKPPVKWPFSLSHIPKFKLFPGDSFPIPPLFIRNLSVPPLEVLL
jgi:hypothetical protein